MYSAVTPEYRRAIIRNQPNAIQAKRMRGTAVSVYAGLFLFIVTLLTLSSGGSGLTPDTGIVATTQAVSPATSISGPDRISVDQLTAASAVTNLAETANLPVAGDLREATTTLYIQKQLAQTDAEVINKPQIVQPTTSQERGIGSYVTVEGDDLAKVAARFNISVQTLRWANNMTSDAVSVGSTLVIPRVDGVVYTVKAGDTLDSLAERYKVSAEHVLLHNDLVAEEPLVEGAKIVLPDGDLPETERPGYVAPRPAPTYSWSASYGNMGGSIISQSYGFGSRTSGNRYAAGNCTWYAYERRIQLGRPIGGMWGNAYSWAHSAQSSGYVVNKTPAPGAIIQTSSGGGGYGHVGVVERIEDGHIIVSDMNYAGYNVVTWRKIPLSQAGSYNFIH